MKATGKTIKDTEKVDTFIQMAVGTQATGRMTSMKAKEFIHRKMVTNSKAVGKMA